MKIETTTKNAFLADSKDVEILANRIAPLIFQNDNFTIDVELIETNVGSTDESIIHQTLSLHATIKNIVQCWAYSALSLRIEAHTLSSVDELKITIEDFFVELLSSSCKSDLDYILNNGAIHDSELAEILGQKRFATYFSVDGYMLTKYPLSIQTQMKNNNRPEREAKIDMYESFGFR